jgi:hypothetical protein
MVDILSVPFETSHNKKSHNMPSSSTATGNDLVSSCLSLAFVTLIFCPQTPYSGDPRVTIPLLRAFSSGVTDHFYTTNFGELQNADANLGYVAERTPGYIFVNQQPSTVPLYRLYSASGTDHFYTIDANEKDNAIKGGYSYEGIPGYVYTDNTCGGVPLYRSYNGAAVDHFYTASLTEKDNAVTGGWKFEFIACYILPF